MKHKPYFRTGLSLLGLFLAASCQHDADISPTTIDALKLTEQAKEMLMNDFSQGFAKALQNEPALRTYLKTKAAEQIDGDYDVMYVVNKDQRVDDKHTMHELLAKYLDANGSMKTIEDKFLNLNIKVLGFKTPVENWDTQGFVPNVAVRSYDEKAKTITAYNGRGERLQLDAHQQPDQLTVVVEESERIHINSYQTLEKDWNESVVKFLPYDVEGDAVASIKSAGTGNIRTGGVIANAGPRRGGVNTDPAWWTQDCPRTSAEAAIQKRNKLESFTISKSAFEKASDNWTEGRLDITATLFTVRGDSKQLDQLPLFAEVYKEFTYTYSGVDDNGRTRVFTATVYGYDRNMPFGSLPAIMGEWDRTLNGDTWKLSFIETDPGDRTITTKKSFTSTFEVGIKTTDAANSKNIIGFNADYKGSQEGSVEVVYKDVDEPLGEQSVYYCNKFGMTQIYGTGDVVFVITPVE